MPGRSRGGTSPRSSPARQYHGPPPPPPSPAPPASRPPGMLGQMGAVAAGSALGHVAGEAMASGFQPAGTPASGGPVEIQNVQQQPQAYNPCQRELQLFLDCAQRNTNIEICAGFNEALRQCKVNYGMDDNYGKV